MENETKSTLNEPIDIVEASFKASIEKVRTEAMRAGFTAACAIVREKIKPWSNPKASRRDLERIFKELEHFLNVPLEQEDANESKANGTDN